MLLARVPSTLGSRGKQVKISLDSGFCTGDLEGEKKIHKNVKYRINCKRKSV